ncbi:putative nucleolar complex protein [Spathaspora sp. JA1]|nr:putative nucleolar complex protein [Spathaspora sp. JA1]
MAGSQLKQLKAALKEKGLIGQTNTKSKKAKHSRSEVKRDEKQDKINAIRDEFNKFDTRINRTKHDVSIIQQGKFVKMGSKQHNETSARNGAVLKTMKTQYELEKGRRGKTGGVLDKRFGESDKHLSKEEKMLARFTKERQNASRKRNVFSLESDNEEEEDEDDGGFTLTHSGHALSLDDEPSVKYVDEENAVEDQDQPARKKSKNEVMKEIIAKSKFYKHQRQKEFAKTQDEIDDLDEEFGDIMDDLRNVQPAAPVFSTKTPESIEYDSKVRELTYDRRAVPADRTKTKEELVREHEDKLKKLESDRLKRMEGFVESREAEADDLDDEFWAGSDEDEEQGYAIKDGQDEEEEESESEEDEHTGRPKSVKTPPIIMPYTHHEFVEEISSLDSAQQANHIKKIIQAYKPNLAQGNKEKMNNFVGILFQHVLYLGNKNQEFQHIVEIIKKLAETYNEKLVETVRQEILHIQARILKHHLHKSDLIFFVVIGYLFSTSDHYHLIVTPCLILMNELVTSMIYSSEPTIQSIGHGVFTVDVLLSYQRFAKRFDPEIVNFIEFAMLQLIPEPSKMPRTEEMTFVPRFSLSKNETINSDGVISISQLFDSSSTSKLKPQLLVKLIDIMDNTITIYKEKSCLVEILDSFIPILKHLVKYYAISIPKLTSTLDKFVKLQTNSVKSRKPLTLQHHRALAMATFAPKFEENFNPDKKSYDVNKERADLNKIKHQIKMEKKAALKDIRQENKFIAREQISEKKAMYEEYHKKMANIVNSISTVEGAEKNQYEREKKQRKNK